MTGRWVEVGPGRSVFRPAGGGSQSGKIAEDALVPYVNQAGVAVVRQISERWQREVWPRIHAARARGGQGGEDDGVVLDPVSGKPAEGVYLLCPLDGCAWMHRRIRADEAQASVRGEFASVGDLASAVVAEAVRLDDAAAEAHLRGDHSLRDFLVTIARLRAELAAAGGE